MKRYLLLLAFFVPTLALAATLGADKVVTVSVPPPDNTYLAGSSIHVEAPLPADLSVAGTNVVLSAPIAGDVLALSGTLEVEKPVEGDVRALGGTLRILGDVAGDIAALGARVVTTGKARDLLIAGESVEANGSATGDVVLYGVDVTINGTYDGNVTVVATNNFTVGDHAHIGGALRYNAPTQVLIPATATVLGTVSYTGPYRYLPTNKEANTFAFFGTGVFLIVRLLAAMIVTGVVVGIFPRATTSILDRFFTATARRTVLSLLLGLGVLLLTPVAILLLLVSSAGVDVAFLLAAAFVTVVLFSAAFAGALLGALLRKHLLSRISGNLEFTWKDAVLGAVALTLIRTTPGIGPLVYSFFILLSLGIVSVVAYRFAFTTEYE